MKYLLYSLIIFSAIYFVCTSSKTLKHAQTKVKITNPFDTLKYDKVVAYDYNGSPEIKIVSKGVLLQTKGRIFQQKELSKLQIGNINHIVGDTKSYGGATAACFDPHLGLVYYLQGKIVGHISVFLACNFLESVPSIPASESHKTNLCDKCFDRGFSKSARKKISAFVKELQFSHWQLNSELFDK